MSNEEGHAGFRRPHYGDGDRLRIIRRGQYFGQECVIAGTPTRVMVAPGYVLTYLYIARLQDGTTLDVAEELLAPLANISWD